MPTHEERITALEQITEEHHIILQNLSKEVKHVKSDMHASFKQLVEYHIRTENQIDARFDQVDARFSQVESRLDKIETTMATKDDMSAMEGRILDAFQQLVTMVSTQYPRSK